MANQGPSAWYVRDNAPTSTIGWSAVTAWATVTVYAAGVLRRQLATPTVGNERVFACIIAGTSLVSEPTWVVTKGAKTAEAAGPTWQEVTGQPGVNGDHGGATNANTTASAAAATRVLTFSAVPANVAVGQLVIDKTVITGVIPAGATVASFTSTTVTISADIAGAGVGNGDAIAFTNCPTWLQNKNVALTLGMIVQRGNCASLQMVTTAGTTGNGAEPAFSDTAGVTTADNTVTWTSLGVVGNFAAWAAPHARLANAFATNWGVAGNAFYVGDDHAETQGSALTLAGAISQALPFYTFCVDHTASMPLGPSNLSTTASISTTGAFAITLANQSGSNIYMNGISLKAGSAANSASIAMGATGNAFNLFMDNCGLVLNNTNAASVINVASNTQMRGCKVVLNNTPMTFGAVGQAVILTGSQLEWKNTANAIAGSVPTTLFGASAQSPGNLLCHGVDLSAAGSGKTLVGSGLQGLRVTFINCKFGASVTVAATPTMRGEIVDVIVSDSAATNYQQQRYTYEGTLSVETVIVRTGGAVMGATSLSWKIVTSANSLWTEPFSAPMDWVWNPTTAANVTVTMYGIVNAAIVPLNDQVWASIEYLGSSATPMASFSSGTKANNLASGVALTADTSAWDSLLTARANTTAYVVGNTIKLASNPGRVFFCTTAGTSAGSEPGGYASAVDGGSVTDNTAVFRAACRFRMAVTLSSPQPQLAGYLRAIVNAAQASQTWYVDPAIALS